MSEWKTRFDKLIVICAVILESAKAIRKALNVTEKKEDVNTESAE